MSWSGTHGESRLLGSGAAWEHPGPTPEDRPEGAFPVQPGPSPSLSTPSLPSGRAWLCAQPWLVLSTCPAHRDHRSLQDACLLPGSLRRVTREPWAFHADEAALLCQLRRKIHSESPSQSQSFPFICPNALKASEAAVRGRRLPRHLSTVPGCRVALNLDAELSKFPLHPLQLCGLEPGTSHVWLFTLNINGKKNQFLIAVMG